MAKKPASPPAATGAKSQRGRTPAAKKGSPMARTAAKPMPPTPDDAVVHRPKETRATASAALVDALREEIQAASNDREVLIQRVLSLTARIGDQQESWHARYADLASQHEALKREQGQTSDANAQLSTTLSALQSDIAEGARERAAAQLALHTLQIEMVHAKAELDAQRNEFEDAKAKQAEAARIVADGLAASIQDRDHQIEVIRRQLEQSEQDRAAGMATESRMAARLTEIEARVTALASANAALEAAKAESEALAADRLVEFGRQAEQAVRDLELRAEALASANAALEAASVESAASAITRLEQIERSAAQTIRDRDIRIAAIEAEFAATLRSLESANAALEADNAEYRSQLALASASLNEQQEEMSALVSAMAALDASRIAGERDAAARRIAIENEARGLVAAAQAETEQTKLALARSESEAAQLQDALSASLARQAEIELAWRNRELQIAEEFRERLNDAEDALRALDHDRTETSEADRKAHSEIAQLQMMLSSIRVLAEEAANDRDRARQAAGAADSRNQALEDELSAALATLQAASEERKQQADSITRDTSEDLARHVGIIEALEGDLKAVMAELATRDALIGLASQRPALDALEVAAVVELLDERLARGETEPEMAAALEHEHQALSMLTIRLAERTGALAVLRKDTETSAAMAGDAEALRHWRASAEGEMDRLRADRARMDEELSRLEAANEDLQRLNARLARSVYWRVRDAARRLVTGNGATHKPQPPSERSTWPED